MFSTRQLLAAALGCSAAMSLAGPTFAQTYPAGQVNISGATLFRDFFTFPASTNDYIDVDGDSNAGSLGTFPPPQLALDFTDPGFPGSSHIIFNYRGVGSGNGLAEMRDYQLARLDGRAPADGLPAVGAFPAEGGIINRTEYVDQTGNLVPGIGNAANNGGSPIIQNSIDIGVMDVPTSWFVTNPTVATPSWDARPGDASYGTNPLQTVAGQGNQLKSLSDGITNTPLNTNTAAPDNHTVYDTTLAWTPVGYIANPGTGIEDIRVTELQHHFTTGRLPSGENLVSAVRDSGSGTRNAAMNSLGIDPSFGRGENISAKNSTSNFDELGPDFSPDAKGGSSRMEGVVQNSRLALGYTGLLGGSRAIADMNGGKYELLNVMKDIDGDGDQSPDGNTYLRPSANAIINNADANTGWQFGGAQTMATVGDPNANRDVSDPKKTANPAVANATAAGYLNNITDSIAAFVSLPADPNNAGSPGEALVNNFTLTAAIEAIADNGIDFSGGNSAFNASVNSASLAALSGTVSVNATGSVGAGLVPTRTAGLSYTDGNVADQYLDVDGNAVGYGNVLGARNHIAGDFNNDGDRSIADVADMMQWAQFRGIGINPASGSQPETGTGLVVEIIGDFDGDGNFNEEDVRYWADGLHMVGGSLDRKAGFTAVDTEYGDNFFGTSLATPKAYAFGDSRGDIAGNIVSMGAKPTGADGTIDAQDIDYVFAQFVNNLAVTDGAATWADIDEAIYFDLSADMTGDMVVDQMDVDELVQTILGTDYGDVNLDGVIDATDEGIVSTNLGLSGLGWAGGDLNGDGVTDALDQAFFGSILTGDLNGDGFVGVDDLNIVLVNWNQSVTPGDLASGDPTGEGFVGVDDLNIVLVNWNNGTPPTAGGAIPEPASLALMGLGGLAMLRRRR